MKGAAIVKTSDTFDSNGLRLHNMARSTILVQC